MKIISHRGLIEGSNPLLENAPNHIHNLVNFMDVEIDLHADGDKLFLGHDKPIYEIDLDFLLELKDKLWIHCKTLETVKFAHKNLSDCNWFFHDTDKMTLTSKGKIWCYPGIYVTNGITVEPNYNRNLPDVIAGVCTDFPLKYLNNDLC